MDDAFVRQVQLLGPEQDEQRTGHPWDLSPIASLAHGLALDRKVTYLIGENGSGKSTLLEAITGAASRPCWRRPRVRQA